MATNKPIHIDQLFGELTPAEEPQQWRVVYTKSKREKKLAEFAQKNNITYFLPLINSTRTYQYRKVEFTKPMFPGYLFVKCSPEEQRELIITGHCMTFLRVKNEPEFLDDLHRIYHFITEGEMFLPHAYVEKGYIVEIIDGPLKGHVGLVEDATKLDHIILNINVLQQSVSVSIDSSLLEVIGHQDDL
jgi:transcription antitermination factor NusG